MFTVTPFTVGKTEMMGIFINRGGTTRLAGIFQLLKRMQDARTSLVVQWLRLHAYTAEGMGSISGWVSSTCRAVQPKKKKSYGTSLDPTCHMAWPKKKKRQYKTRTTADMTVRTVSQVLLHTL